MSSAAPGYSVEQFIMSLWTAILLALGIIQLSNHKFIQHLHSTGDADASTSKVVFIHKLTYRLGVLASLIFAIRCVDPVPVKGVYTQFEVWAFGANSTVLLLWIAAGIVYKTLEVSFKIMKQEESPLLRPIIIGFCVGCLIVANYAVIVRLFTGNLLYSRAVWLLYGSIGMFAAIAVIDVGYLKIKRSIEDLQARRREMNSSKQLSTPAVLLKSNSKQDVFREKSDSSSNNVHSTGGNSSGSRGNGKRGGGGGGGGASSSAAGTALISPSILSALSKLKRIVYISNIFVGIIAPYQIFLTILLIDEPSVEEADKDSYSPVPGSLFTFQLLFLSVFYWYTWIPLEKLRHGKLNTSHSQSHHSTGKKSKSTSQSHREGMEMV